MEFLESFYESHVNGSSDSRSDYYYGIHISTDRILGVSSLLEQVVLCVFLLICFSCLYILSACELNQLYCEVCIEVQGFVIINGGSCYPWYKQYVH